MSLNDNFHNVNSTYLELRRDLACSTPQQCVTLTHSVPSLQMFFALKTKLQNCTEKWLREFLDLDGLDSLLNTLQELSGQHGFTCFSDAILLMDCIMCIRSILNTTIGLEFFINGDSHTKKLTLALSCNDSLPKKQVFEMLTAMCVYNNIGYLRVMEGLSYVKSECDQVHRFSFVTNDLQKSEVVTHKTAILTFINSIINCTPEVTERNRIRNEFIGLNLLDMLLAIRNEEPDEDMLLQLEVFHERKLSDEECVRADNNIDFNSPQDLQEQIQARVFGSQKMANFVSVLQDLLAIETVYPDNSVKLWQAVDNLIHYVVHAMPVCKLDTLQSELQSLFVQSHLCPQPVYSCLEEMLDTVLKLKQSSSPCYRENEIGVGKQATSNSKKCDIGRRKEYTTTGTYEGVDTKRNQCPENDMDMQRNTEERSYATNNCSNEMNKTVTQFGQCSVTGIANNCNIALVDSYGSDLTLVINKNGCSPCDITYFRYNSNVDRGLRSSSNPSDVYAESSASNSENASPGGSSDQSLSISSKLSKACNNQTTCISNNCCDSKMNINVTESKAEHYNHYKVSSMLDELFTPLYEYLQRAATECDDELNDLCKPELVNTKTSQCWNRKPNNQIGRRLLPAPSRGMRPLNWVTLEDERIVGREPCVWLPPLSVHEKVTVDFQKLENEFHVPLPEKLTVTEEVVLLDASTRLKINLFLNRMDSGVEELVSNIEEDKTDQLSLSMLQYLIKILPCPEEIQMLRHYSGPRLELGMAEQLVLLLSDNSEYSIVLEGYAMRAEFNVTVGQFKTCLTAMISLASLILQSTELKQVLHYILDAGNYMNYGNFNSNVAGFKLTTLGRLKDIKSVFANVTLIHHVIQAVSNANKSGFNFIKDLFSLEKDATCSIEDMKTNINKLNSKLRYFMYNLSSASTKVQVKFQPFIENLRFEFAKIQNATTELRNLTDQMAAYFCEDVTKFNLQDCFKCIVTFCKEIKKCQLDMASVLRQQQQLLERKGRVFHYKRKNNLTSLAFGQNAAASSSLIEDEAKVLENILDQLHQGIFNPNVKTVTTTPDKDDTHTLEMSCIPFEGSPSLDRHRPGTIAHDHMLLKTPELVCGQLCNDKCKMPTSTAQKILPIATTCTAQVWKDTLTQPIKFPQIDYQNNTSSPINVQQLNTNYSAAFQKKLVFPNNPNRVNTFNKAVRTDGQDVELRRQLGLASHKAVHCRSHSDITDSICINNKWLEYEKARKAADSIGDTMAPIAEPESICNISTLNLENRGKFISSRDVLTLKNMTAAIDVCGLEIGPQIRLPDSKSKKVDKKSAVGGFFSKLGRAVLKPRNVSTDDNGHNGKVINEDKEVMKKTVTLDKENASEKLPVMDKKGKVDGNASKVSKFFQRGGLYRSSKMKKKNLNPVQ